MFVLKRLLTLANGAEIETGWILPGRIGTGAAPEAIIFLGYAKAIRGTGIERRGIRRTL